MANTISEQDHYLSSLIQKCKYENDVDRQIELLKQINSALPKSIRIEFPSLITNDYVSKALDIIEERVIKVAIAV